MLRTLFSPAIVLVIALVAACVGTPIDIDLWEAEVAITSAPDGAQVIWFTPGNVEQDGGPVHIGTTPVAWSTSRGLVGPADAVELVILKPGYGRAIVTVSVEQLRGDEPLHFEVPQFATLAVRSNPMATFELTSADGVAISTGEYAPELVAELTPGVYNVSATRAGYEDHASTLTVSAGEAAAATIELTAIDGPPDGEPRMSVLPSAVVGMSEFDFYDALRGQTRNVANCIDRAMVEDPLAAGDVHITLHLNLPFGTVESTEITQAPFENVEAIDCIQRRLRRVTYDSVGAAGEMGTATFTLRYHRILH